MKYYKLKNSYDLKEIGAFAQAEKINKLGGSDDMHIVGKKRPIDMQWEIPEPIMQNKALLTTYLHVVPFSSIIFLVLKNYFIDFIRTFNIKENNSWKLKVHHKDKIITDYELFHLSYPAEVKRIIKYDHSDFVVVPRSGHFENSPAQPVKIENYKSYQNLKDVLRESEDNLTISYNKMVLDFTRINEDLIRFNDAPFNNGYYVSERLKNAIEEKGFSGMAFREIEDMDKRIKGIY